MPLPTAKAIEIHAFVPLDSIDAIQIGEGYYLQPDGQVAAKPYKLLRLALERSSKVAIAKYAWSGRERLGLLRVRGEAIVLHAMRWPDEIRNPSELAPAATEVTHEEISEAEHLIERMTRDNVEGPDFTDRYTEAIAKLIEAKRESLELPGTPEPAAVPGQLVDLMAALQESVRKAQASRGEDASVHEMATRPSKKATTKKTAKKAPAKKASTRTPRRSA